MTDLAPFLNPFTGDTGEGGREGLVPAPEAGDAAAHKFLSAAGNWAVPDGPDGGTTTIGSIDSVSPSVNGLTIIGVNLYAQSASDTYPGMVNTGSQTLAGVKTFTNQVSITTSSNFLSLGSTNPTIYTSASTTSSRTFTTPDANSNSIQPLVSATASNWVTHVDSSGVQYLSQPAFSDISGSLNLATQVTGILLGANGGTGVANTGLTINLSSGGVGKVLTSDSSGNASYTALSSLGIIAVNGTLNRITASTMSGTATIDISSSYVGQTSITTLGTITTGDWNGSVIPGQFGGTGIANTGLTINLGSGGTGKILTSDASGNAYWDIAPAAGVSSITGTSAQVLANGTFGIMQTGAVILTLPQSIATTSSVQFANVTATTKVTTAAFQLTTSPTNNYVLTSDASGNGSWTALSTLSVTSITGTANQVLANGTVSTPQTGSVTLTLPQSIATSSSVQFGTLSIGQSAGPLADTKIWLNGDLSTVNSTHAIGFNAYRNPNWRFYGPSGDYAYALVPSNTSFVIKASTTSSGGGNLITWKDAFSISSVNGNIGIAITTPTYPLHISSANNANAAGNPSVLLVGDANKERVEIRTSSDGVFKLSRCNGTISSPTVITASTSLGNYQFGGYDGSDYSRSAWIQAFGTETWSSTARGTDMAFFTTPNASTTIQERVRITQRGDVWIGNSSLSHRLDVYDDINSATVGRIRNANAGSSAFSAFYLGNNGSNVLALFLNSSARSTDGGVNTATIRNDAGALRLQSLGATNGLYIAATSGNVGINNSNPTTAKLVISGTGGQEGLDLSSTDQYANLRVIRNSLGSDKHMYIGLGSGATSNLYFYSNNVNGMTFSGGGNLALSGQLAVAGASFNVGTLTVLRGDTSNLGTAVFYGSGINTHINYSTAEDTYIRGGKVTSTTYINDANTSGTLRLNNISAPLLFFSSFNSTYYNNVNFRFYQEFTSSLQGITTSVTVNHGLGGTPTWYQVYIQCVSANSGYSVGDQVMIANQYTPSDSINTAWCSSSQIGYRGTTRIVIADKGTTNAIAITVASWNLVFKAWRAI